MTSSAGCGREELTVGGVARRFLSTAAKQSRRGNETPGAQF